MNDSLIKSAMVMAGESFVKHHDLEKIFKYLTQVLGVEVGGLLDNKDYYLIRRAQGDQGWLELCDKELKHVASSRTFEDHLG